MSDPKRTVGVIGVGAVVIVAALLAITLLARHHPPPPAPTASPAPTRAGVTPTVGGTPTARVCRVPDRYLPDPVCTPGVTNPAVTQENIHQTICVSGWTSTVRPPVSYTEPLKVKQMREYGFTDPIGNYEEDHLIPLELGGHPTDPMNLWPESYTPVGAHEKDVVENWLKDAVCKGTISLATAQQAIAQDWFLLWTQITATVPVPTRAATVTPVPLPTRTPQPTSAAPVPPSDTPIPHQAGKG